MLTISLKRSYRLVLSISAVFYVVYWLAPWTYGYLDSDTQSLLADAGDGALLPVPDWLWWFVFGVTLVGYLGMYFFRKNGRLLFLAAMIATLILSTFDGASVITAFEVVVIDTAMFLGGFTLAMAYYSRISEQFY